jgi:chromate reductase
MTTIVGIAGSLREASFNAALLRSAVGMVPDGVTLEIGSIRGIPLYDGDVEHSEGIPPPVAALKDRIAAADGLLLVSPEYNNSLPGVLKNAVDWLTRPPADIPRVFGDKPVAVIGASPGRFGTQLAQPAWIPVFRTLGTRPYFGKSLLVAGARQVFSESGELVDPDIRERLQAFLAGFSRFAAEARRPG